MHQQSALGLEVYMRHSDDVDVWSGGPQKPVNWMHDFGRDDHSLDGPTLLICVQAADKTLPAGLLY